MMTWNLVCDSSSDLKPAAAPEAGAAGIMVVPLTISVGGRDYPDDAALDVPALVEAMQQEKGPSSTACPSPAAFAAAFEQADCTVCFTISSNLSGTYNAALLGREMALEAHPGKKIAVIDSRSTAGAMVLLVRRAQELVQAAQEPDFDRICAQLRNYQKSLRTIFTLENYDNLIKNGRMRPLVGNLLHTLGIRIIADATPEGTIHVAGKARGEARTFRSIVDMMRASKDCTGAEVILTHCENLSAALQLKDLIQAQLPVKSVTILSCRGLTSFYAMKNGLILVY